MGDLISFLKIIFMTILLILILQFKVGEDTAENKIQAFLRTSPATEYVVEAADNLVKIFSQTKNKVVGSLRGLLGSNSSGGHLAVGERAKKFSIERSQKAKEEAAARAAREVEGETQDARSDEGTVESY